MKNLKIALIVISITILFVGCQEVERPRNLTVKIIETSDVHGAAFPIDFVNNRNTNHSLAQVMTYVEQEREKKGQVVILLDNGDLLQGDPIVYYSNYEKTVGEHNFARMLNFMKYDAATVGNHDIETGHQVYDKVRSEFEFPWLAANAVDTKTGRPYFDPYVVLERKGIKIVILGLITPAIPGWLPEALWEGMAFEDMIESANKWVKEIRENEKPDILIGLFHAGIEATYNMQSADVPMNENASRLVAEQVPGFDVVFVGHDHHGWNEEVTNWAGNKVLILGPTSKARDVAVAEIKLSLNKVTNHYNKTVTGEIIKMQDFETYPAFMANFGDVLEEGKEYVSKPLGYLTQTISSRDAFFGDASFTDLIHRIQLDLTDADISLTAPLSFDMTIEKGDMYVRDLFNLYRFENLLYTMELGGIEIKDFLEYSTNLWFNTMKSGKDHMINFAQDSAGNLMKSRYGNGHQLENAYYNFDTGEGINYTVDLSKTYGERVNIISMADGSPFDLNKKYTVAVNSYRGSGGGNHLIAGSRIRQELLKDRVTESSGKDFRYLIMKWIEQKEQVTPSVTDNWTLIPADWASSAAQRDRKLLFGNEEK